MPKRIYSIFYYLLTSILALSASMSISAEPQKYIIKLKSNNLLNSVNAKQQIAGIANLDQDKLKVASIANNTFSLSIDSINQSDFYIQNIFNLIKFNPQVSFITKDRVGYFNPIEDPEKDLELVNLFEQKFSNQHLSNDLNHSLQWDEFNGPEGVFLESAPGLNDGAWQMTHGSSMDPFDVVVAVLDTGIEYNTDLDANVVKHPITNNYFGWNFSANNDDLSDETGGFHGTHVAGTIAAAGPNVMGMGPELKILPVKIPDSTGMFYESNVIKAIYWAIGETVDGVDINPRPAKVINMSFGIDEYIGKEVDECSPAVQEAIDYAREKGVIIVVAAGNSNMEHDLGSPGGCKGALRVASTGPTGLRSYFSNYGEGVSFAAPGGDKRYGMHGGILSTVKHETGQDNSGYDFYQGTSMAAPHVAGLAGLIYAANSSSDLYITAKDVEEIMYATTHDFAHGLNGEYSCVGEKSCGHGIINARSAIETVLANYDIIFSSPTSDFLGKKTDDCRSDLAKPKHNNIIKPEGEWNLKQDSNICQYPVEYTHPVISVDNNNKLITAKYGHVEYQLDYTNRYTTCYQIGYDGVGCYKN